jgi:hypothetical protein
MGIPVCHCIIVKAIDGDEESLNHLHLIADLKRKTGDSLAHFGCFCGDKCRSVTPEELEKLNVECGL